MAEEKPITTIKYKIIVTKVETGIPYKSQEWEQLRDDELNDPSGKNEKYGYVTKEGTKSVETNILEQVVDDLDMPEVIKAINKL